MTHVSLSSDVLRPLPFYLALEEYVARTMPAGDYFLLWQVTPTVIFGRNQHLENEVDVDYCRRHGIAMYRRKSGGGCVYADLSNLMLSFVTPTEDVGFAFNRYVNLLLLVLRKLGIDAVGTRHNDVLIDDRKVSGTACYKLPNRSIVHGTLLYDTNMNHMLNAITPSAEKLESKGIQSVRQRITLLKDHTDVGLEEVKALILKTLCDDEFCLSDDAVREVEQIERQYHEEQFIHLV